mmetsp:Transcript_48284/g.156853  ORF Transcript_48284/g.156853 Transcript_48284/m.156853 type:complete len:127 (-) Transcript_48284:258-638(-)
MATAPSTSSHGGSVVPSRQSSSVKPWCAWTPQLKVGGPALPAMAAEMGDIYHQMNSTHFWVSNVTADDEPASHRRGRDKPPPPQRANLNALLLGLTVATVSAGMLLGLASLAARRSVARRPREKAD